MSRRRRSSIALAVALVLAPSVTRAAPLRAAQPDEARALYERGVEHFNLAEYDLAIESFKEAYRRSRFPGLLYNIAQSHRRKGDCAQAETFYRSYLEQKPDAPDRARVQESIAEMEACAARSDTPVSAPPSVAPPSVAPPSVAPPSPVVNAPVERARPPLRAWVPFSLLAATLALGGTAAGLLGSVATGLDGCTPRCGLDEADGFKARAYAGYALVGIAAASAVATVITLPLWARGRARARVQVAPAAASLSLRGVF